jgi:hypothetical protein
MVSAYHQLHCLRELHVSFVALASAKSNGTVNEVLLSHAEHCFDYLRQAIMCVGDMTLEPPDKVPEPGMSRLKGYDVAHVCTKWEDVRGWVAKNDAKKLSSLDGNRHLSD